MASLLTIPLELLVAVSEYLPTEDLGSLRLVCKQTEKSLYEWFSKEFFFKKQFMLTHKSLQALIDISKHASLSKKLVHIIIATNVYSEIPLRFRDDDAATRYIQGYEDQKALLGTGIDREMLTEAFERLENLTTVGIRDFNAGNRVRDGKSWSSWGATTVYRETGIELRFADRDSFGQDVGTRFTSRVFSSVLYALGKANRRPTEFEVLLRQRGLPDTAFFLPDYIRPTVEPILQNTSTLLLNVDLKPRYLHTHSNGTSVDPNAGRSLRRFLHFTPNLVHLRLNFEKHLVANNEDFLQWLATPKPTTSSNQATFLDPAPVALPLLKNLELGQLSARADILFNFISKFAPTLEDLSLWRMNIPAAVAPPHGHKPNFWRDFFRKLSKTPRLALTHLKVGMLQQDHMYVTFKSDDANNNLNIAVPAKKVKEYAGADMGKFWEELQEEVTVDWPATVPVDLDASEDDSEDEDEEMDDDDDDDEYDSDEYLEDGNQHDQGRIIARQRKHILALEERCKIKDDDVDDDIAPIFSNTSQNQLALRVQDLTNQVGHWKGQVEFGVAEYTQVSLERDKLKRERDYYRDLCTSTPNSGSNNVVGITSNFLPGSQSINNVTTIGEVNINMVAPDVKRPKYGNHCLREMKRQKCDHGNCDYYHSYQSARWAPIRPSLPANQKAELGS